MPALQKSKSSRAVDNAICCGALLIDLNEARSHSMKAPSTSDEAVLISLIVDCPEVEFRARMMILAGWCFTSARHTSFPIPVLPVYIYQRKF
jgi:hypothetical protein